MGKVKFFFNENHKRDKISGRMIKRDFSGYNAVECDLCGGSCKGGPSFSYRGKSYRVFNKLVAGLSYRPQVDFGKLDYCVDCHIRLEGSRLKLHHKFKK